MSKAAGRSSRMRTDDLESFFAICRASVTESSTVSFVNSFECFGYEWKESDRSVVFYKIRV